MSIEPLALLRLLPWQIRCNAGLMIQAKLLQLAALWLGAWLFSLALVTAGRRWPAPLLPDPAVIWTLLLAPAALLLLLLLSRWRLPPEPREGESAPEAQSLPSSQLPEQEQSP